MIRLLRLPVLLLGFSLFVPAFAAAQIVIAPGPGAPPVVRVIEASGADRSFLAYPEAFPGGVFVALGDVDGDGVLDIITGAGPGGGPHVRVWNGVTLAEIGGFFAYDPAFPGGVRVAAGDVNGDGKADIITGAGPGGGPHVRVWSGADFTELGGFFAYDPAFPGGVTVAAGDVNGDGRADIITGAGPGGGPHVRVWSGATFSELGGFFAYDPAFPGGVNVAAGDVNGDGRADIITGAGPGGGPHVRVWNGASFGEIGGFFAYDPSFAGGVTVGVIDLTYDGKAEIITGPGPGFGPLVGIYNGADFSLLGAFFAFDPAFGGGVSIGSSGGSSALRFTSATTTTFGVGTLGTFSITTAGGASVPVLTYTGALPAGVTFTDNGDRTATLSGTPGAGTGGSYPLTFTATASGLPPLTQSFTLTIDQAPAITSANATTFVVGTLGTFTVTTTGSPAAALTATGALPAGVTFTDNGNGTATLAGTPDAGTGGTYPLTITAASGVGINAVQSFTLTVNQAPAFTSTNAATFSVGAAGTFTVTTTGVPPVVSIARTGAALPAGVNYVDNGNGTATLIGTPGAGTSGSIAITFTINNGVGGNVVQNFTLTVQEGPTITSAAATTFAIGVLSTFTVTTTGFPAAGLVQGGATLPSGVNFVDNGNGTGTLSGTPAAGTAGPYALTFTASNNAGSAVQNFTLTVACPAITVTPAGGALPGGIFGQAYSQTFGATGGSGHTFAVTAGAPPSGLTLSPGGALTGPPTNTGTFNFTVTATDSFGCTGSTAYTLAVLPNAVNETFNNGVGNTQYVVAPTPSSATPAVLVTGTVLSNDAAPGTLTAGPANITTTNSGAVAMSANGAFVYTPFLGFAGPSDTFVYTLTDGNGLTNTATVTINLSGMVWYVNNSGANGTGQSHSPFNTLANAEAPSAAGSFIYVHTGSGTTTGNLAMDANQTLFGQGAVFTLNGLTIAAGARPTLSGTVTLANNDAVTAVNFSGASPALTASGLSQAVVVDQVSVTGGTTALSLSNVSGPVTVTNASFTNTTNAEVLINQGTGTVSIAAVISSSVGRSIDIQNRSGGTVTFSGPITDTAQGVFLNANTGSTVTFAGGLGLSTGANAGFTATGGGTVNVCDENPCNPAATGALVNTIATTTGTALNVANTNIGTNHLEFRSVSSGTGASGPANGIILNNTGTTAGFGGLKIKGTGGAGSGGTIQRSSNAGVVMTSTRDVSLANLIIQNGGDDGIRGLNVTNFTMTNSTVSTNGDAVTERGLEFTNLLGAASITGSLITASAEDNLYVKNGTGALTLATSSTTYSNTSAAIGNDGILFLAADVSGSNNANMAISVTNCTFTSNRGDHFQAASDAASSATMNVTFQNNDLNNVVGTNLGAGITLNIGGTATMTFNVSNNGTAVDPFTGAFSSAITVNTVGSAQMSGTINNNVIGNPTVTDSGSFSGNGVSIAANGASQITVAVTNNQIRGYSNLSGINIHQRDGNGSIHATVTGNTLSNPGTFASNGLIAQAGAIGTDAGLLCVDVGGAGAAANSLAGSGANGGTDFRVRQRFGTTVRLPGYGGGSTDTAAVVAFIQGRNTGNETGSATVQAPGGGFVGGAGCNVP